MRKFYNRHFLENKQMKFCEILIFCTVDQTIQRIKIHIQLGGLIIIVVQKNTGMEPAL